MLPGTVVHSKNHFTPQQGNRYTVGATWYPTEPQARTPGTTDSGPTSPNRSPTNGRTGHDNRVRLRNAAYVLCVAATIEVYRRMTQLEAQWEAILDAEGLGAKLRRPPNQALSNATTDVVCTAYADSPVLARWTKLTHEVNNLPPWFKHRGALVTLCETGYVSEAARVHKISRRTVERALKAMREYHRHGE